MPHQLFLSHDARDFERANALSRLITRVTLGQITVWHSSDTSPNGGLKPGNVWLDEIRDRLTGSRAVVALLTPTSISRPWLLFESGFGAAQVNCDVIPVCVGIDSLSDIPFPLAMYQAFQLTDYESLKRFIEKLAAKYEIQFDEEMAKPVLLEAVKQLSQAANILVGGTPAKIPSVADAIEVLKEHIDKRLVAYMSSPSRLTGMSSVVRYNVSVDLSKILKSTATEYVEIAEETSVQDVFDHVYYMLEGEVEAYKYLEQWLLRDKDTKERLIIREVQSRIRANAVFSPGSKWEVVRLSSPYKAEGSPK